MTLQQSDAEFEYVDGGEQIQVREGEITEAWIRSDLNGEDLLWKRGQYKADGAEWAEE